MKASARKKTPSARRRARRQPHELAPTIHLIRECLDTDGEPDESCDPSITLSTTVVHSRSSIKLELVQDYAREPDNHFLSLAFFHAGGSDGTIGQWVTAAQLDGLVTHLTAIRDRARAEGILPGGAP